MPPLGCLIYANIYTESFLKYRMHPTLPVVSSQPKLGNQHIEKNKGINKLIMGTPLDLL